MKFLLQAGANKGRDDHDRYTPGDAGRINHGTPLIWAASAGNVEVVKILLDAGANKYATDYWGHTALWQARHNHRQEVESLLTNAGPER